MNDLNSIEILKGCCDRLIIAICNNDGITFRNCDNVEIDLTIFIK